MTPTNQANTPDSALPLVVAYNEAGRVALPDASMLRVFCAGARLVSTGDPAMLPTALAGGPVAVLTNTMNSATLQAISEMSRRSNPRSVIVLLVDRVHAEFTRALEGKENVLVDHIVAVRHGTETDQPRAHEGSSGDWSHWSTTDLRATLQKLIRKEFFGAEKYLRTGARITTFPVTSSKDRDPLHQETYNFAIECGLSQSIANSAKQIVQEMLLNAIYDAPNAAGRHEVKERSGRPVDLAPADHGRLQIGFDGDFLAVSVWDPFGLFKRDTFFTYARKALFRASAEDIIDTKIEGAGLGLMTVYLRSHGLICNVDAGHGTEVIALIDTGTKVRDFEKIPRSIHYFNATLKEF